MSTTEVQDSERAQMLVSQAAPVPVAQGVEVPASVVLLPTEAMLVPEKLERVYLGLGWSSVPGGQDLDLDASVCLFEGTECVDIISFMKLRDKPPPAPATCVHTGDILTGANGKSSKSAETDLERIYLDLHRLPLNVNIIMLVVNVYTPGATFSQVAQAHCRCVNADTDQELSRFQLANLKGNGLIFGQLQRVAPSELHWRFVALGMARDGRTANDLVRAFAVEATRWSPEVASETTTGASPPLVPSSTVSEVVASEAVAPGSAPTPVPSSTVSEVVAPGATPTPEPSSKVPGAPAPDVLSSRKLVVKPTKSSVAPGLVVATAAGTAAAVAIFTAPSLDCNMLAGEGGGLGLDLTDLTAGLTEVELPDMVDLDSVADAMENLGEMAGEAVSATGEVLGSAVDALGTVADGAVELGGVVIEEAAAVGEDVASAVAEGAAAVGEDVASAASAAGEAVGEHAADLGDAAANLFDSAGQAAGAAVAAVVEGAGQLAGAVADGASSVASAVADGASSVASAVADGASSVASAVAEGASGLAESAGEVVVAVAETAGSAVGAVGEVAIEAAGCCARLDCDGLCD